MGESRKGMASARDSRRKLAGGRLYAISKGLGLALLCPASREGRWSTTRDIQMNNHEALV